MRKHIRYISVAVFMLLCMCFNSYAEYLLPDLSILSVNELNQIIKDIDAETELHHTMNAQLENDILNLVKETTESFYLKQGCSVSWPFWGWDYHYSRNKDLFFFSSHLDYEDQEKNKSKADISVELYYDGSGFHIYHLVLNNELVISDGYLLPDNLIVNTDNVVINQATGLNLSLLTADELHSLRDAVNEEINIHHTPKNDGKVNDVLKKVIEDHYLAKGISVAWPWFDYTYTCDWDCYTEVTRITYEENGTTFRNVPVYAEIYGIDGTYQVYYLKIGDQILLDDRASAVADNVLQYTRNNLYTEAKVLLADRQYDNACFLLDQLGGFRDSLSLKEECINDANQAKYTEASTLKNNQSYAEAAALFESLSDYSDSREQAAECREAIKELSYQRAVSFMRKGSYEQAIQEFSTITDYKDSNQKTEECWNAIHELSYQEALSFMEQKLYTEAINEFVLLGDYKDSRQKTDECNEAIKGDQYAIAMTKMDDHDFEEAIAIFETLPGYSESDLNIQICRDNINQQDYEFAELLFSEGKYEEASTAFLVLGSYKDSSERVNTIQEITASIDREIIFPESEYTVLPGQKVVLDPVVNMLSQDSEEESVLVYTSDNQNAARISKDGTVTAGQPGEAVIHCVAKDNPYIMSDVTIHVAKNVNRIVLSANKADLSVPEQNGNSTTQLTFRIEPEDAYIQTGTWSSNNESVATVDQEGNVQAIGAGRAVLTFTSDDNSKGKKTATCNVNVVQAVTSLELEETSGIIYVGKTMQLKPTIQPKNAANKKLVWTSSNENIATVNANGTVKGIDVGNVTITASSADGPSVSYKATVKIAPVTLKVTGTARCIAKNHVGNSWSKGFYLNNEDIKGTGKVLVENGDKITVGCWITEEDKYPDTGGFSKTIEITPEIMTKGIKIEETVWVTENGGRYSGCSAEWYVVITIKP